VTLIQARPTTYNGIEMRSRLEARVAACLDRCEFLWKYEPRAFGSSSGQYLPDFEMRLANRAAGGVETVYLEVKGPEPDREGRDALLGRMRIIRASEPKAFLALVWASGLEQAVWMVSPPESYWGRQAGWEGWMMLRCPGHPDRMYLTPCYPQGDRAVRVRPWCWECDRVGSVFHDTDELDDYRVIG
jgi:hypothetical protein